MPLPPQMWSQLVLCGSFDFALWFCSPSEKKRKCYFTMRITIAQGKLGKSLFKKKCLYFHAPQCSLKPNTILFDHLKFLINRMEFWSLERILKLNLQTLVFWINIDEQGFMVQRWWATGIIWRCTDVFKHTDGRVNDAELSEAPVSSILF